MSPLAMALFIVMRGLTLIIIADIVLSYFLDPFHPVRRFLDSIVQPLLAPIRRVMPPTGPLDFSPWVLLILIEMVGRLIIEVVS